MWNSVWVALSAVSALLEPPICKIGFLHDLFILRCTKPAQLQNQRILGGHWTENAWKLLEGH